MDIITLKSLLTFDSIYGGLCWDERIQVHYFIAGRSTTLSPKAEEIISRIKTDSWCAPQMRYLKEEVCIYVRELGSTSWQSIEKYINKYPNPLK